MHLDALSSSGTSDAVSLSAQTLGDAPKSGEIGFLAQLQLTSDSLGTLQTGWSLGYFLEHFAKDGRASAGADPDSRYQGNAIP